MHEATCRRRSVVVMAVGSRWGRGGDKAVVVVVIEMESEVDEGVRMLEVDERRKEKHVKYDERARKI